MCKPNPCRNDGVCFKVPGDYICQCGDLWGGKNCQTPRVACNNPPCPGKDYTMHGLNMSKELKHGGL